MFQVTGGRFAMERYPGWFGRLKNHRLANLKILGEGDGPATHTEPYQEEKCGERLVHVFFLTKPVKEYQEGPGAG
jgi:hypothetical protein